MALLRVGVGQFPWWDFKAHPEVSSTEVSPCSHLLPSLCTAPMAFTAFLGREVLPVDFCHPKVGEPWCCSQLKEIMSCWKTRVSNGELWGPQRQNPRLCWVGVKQGWKEGPAKINPASWRPKSCVVHPVTWTAVTFQEGRRGHGQP